MITVSGDRKSLIRYHELGRSAVNTQTSPDHFMLRLAAMGAAGPGAKGTVIHQSYYWGNPGMGIYEFK